MRAKATATATATAVALTILQKVLFDGIMEPTSYFCCVADAFAPPPIMLRNKRTSFGQTSQQQPTKMAFQSEAFDMGESGTNNDIRPVLPIIDRTRFQGSLALTAIIAASNNGLQFQSVPVAESLLALVASVVVVSGATDAVERITASSSSSSSSIIGESNNDCTTTTVMPPYDANGGRFDQSTFMGRYCKMLLACDPRLLLYTEEEVRKYHALAYEDWREVKKSTTPNNETVETDRLLWEAKRVADSALHPETREWIPRPFRMSGYLPFNGPICIAMVSISSTVPLLFWAWMNQSQNALVNYFNGPKTATDDCDDEELERATNDAFDGTLFTSYATAVASALAVTFALATYVQTHYAGEEAAELLRFMSFPSAVIASSMNCYIVRSPEISTGVPLLNKHMENVLPKETSCVAAKRGVHSTTASRAILQMPTYFIPPLILDTVAPLKQFLSIHPEMMVPITTFLLLISFGIGLPCAVGMFPQISSIKAEDVEEKFRGLGHEEFYYNKGL